MAKKKTVSSKGGKKSPKTEKKTEQVRSVPPPFPLAMVICDNIHRDPGSGKLFILGCFSIIGTETVPATHPLMGLYIELTNGRGNVKFKVQLVDAEEVWPPIWTSEAEINFDGPRAVAQLAFMAHNVSFERAGEYRFQLFACDEFLMERRVLLITQDQIEK